MLKFHVDLLIIESNESVLSTVRNYIQMSLMGIIEINW